MSPTTNPSKGGGRMESDEAARTYMGGTPVHINITDSTNVVVRLVFEGGGRPVIMLDGVDQCGLARPGSSGRLSEG